MKPNRVWVFSDLIEKNRRVFKVPVYQRNYDWSDVQCDKLFQDIMIAHERDHKHFVGTIVYIVGLSSSKLEEVLIIDGQQRLTTVYVLLKAIYDISKGVSPRVEHEIEEVMLNQSHDEDFKDENKIKLKPVKTDNKQLQLLMSNSLNEMDRNSNIYKNYVLFNSRIEEALQAGCELRDILDGIKHLEAVEIVLDKSQDDEPQKIFESINSTGLELGLADLIRNYLLMDDENQDELYEDYWMKIEKKVGYRNLGDFVINYLNSQISKSVNQKNAYSLFKEHCEEKNLSHEDVLKDLKRTSKYYGAFIGIDKNCYHEKIMYYLSAFGSIKQTTVVPLLFKILDDYEYERIDEKSLCSVLDYLLTYYVRITACEINKNLSKFMKSLYSRVMAENDYNEYFAKFAGFLNDLRANDRMPNDEEFRNALIYKPLYKKPICKFVLSVIENSTKEQIDVENLTIEHILPQKENAAVWKTEIGKDYKQVYESYLHTLGNLTITGINSELGTKSFLDKKLIISEKSKAVILNKDVLSAERWNEDSILKRANSLSEKLIKIFNYEDIHLDKREVRSLYSVNDERDFSNTKPDGLYFLGEFLKVSSWVDMLTKFIDVAYELNTDLIRELANEDYSISMASSTYISNDKEKTRKGKQIGSSGIYFETNLSANGILSFIGDLLMKLDLGPEDFCFSLSKIQFDINDENTWDEGNIAVAQLFYNLTANLIERNSISSAEIEKMKTKEYTKSLFPSSDYPAFASNRTDNMGNSSHIRYRASPLKFEGLSIFVSTQFFDSDRETVIKWYKEHL